MTPRNDDGDDGGVFTLPTGPAGPWNQLTTNEQAWIAFIRVISCGSDPKITPGRVTALIALLDEAAEKDLSYQAGTAASYSGSSPYLPRGAKYFRRINT